MPEEEQDEILAWLADNPPADTIAIKFDYAKGQDKVFHFKRLPYPSDHAAELVLLDTVKDDERETLKAFLDSYPGRATFVFNTLLEIYYDDLAVGITNVT